jgi:hypothetical protein
MDSPIITVIDVMTREEALAATHECRRHANALRRHVTDIYQRRGFEALDYPTFEAWAEAELANTGYKWALKLKNACVIEGHLREALASPQGENALPELLPTKHAEQLHKLREPQAMATAYQRAMNLATSEGGGGVTTRHVKAAVDVLLDEKRVREAGYPVITHMLDSGEITAKTGREIVREIGALAPQQKSWILGIIGQHSMTNPALIRRVAMLQNQHDFPLRCDIENGVLNGKRLADANVTDWEAAVDAAKRERWLDEVAQRNETQDVEACIVTVYRSRQGVNEIAVKRTLAALEEALGAQDLVGLFELMKENARKL